jgi:hypothetical protein
MTSLQMTAKSVPAPTRSKTGTTAYCDRSPSPVSPSTAKEIRSRSA